MQTNQVFGCGDGEPALLATPAGGGHAAAPLHAEEAGGLRQGLLGRQKPSPPRVEEAGE